MGESGERQYAKINQSEQISGARPKYAQHRLDVQAPPAQSNRKIEGLNRMDTVSRKESNYKLLDYTRDYGSIIGQHDQGIQQPKPMTEQMTIKSASVSKQQQQSALFGTQQSSSQYRVNPSSSILQQKYPYRHGTVFWYM